MKIKFSTYGEPVVILPKDEAEKLLRRGMDDSRVDLILLNVMAGRPMVFTKDGVTVKLEAVENA